MGRLSVDGGCSIAMFEISGWRSVRSLNLKGHILSEQLHHQCAH